MMEKTERFWVEKRDLDFPFYNDEKTGRRELIILAIGFILMAVFAFIPKDSQSFPVMASRILYFLIPTVPFMIAAKGKISLIVKRFRPYDPVLIIAGLMGSFFGSMAIAYMLMKAGLISLDMIRANPAVNMKHDTAFVIGMLIQIFGEEMLKIDAFLVVLTLIYKHSGKRKTGIIIGMLFASLLFGAMHYQAYGNWFMILFVQGFSGLVFMYLYLRTKNVFVPFWAHVLLDTIALLGSSGSDTTADAIAFMSQLIC